MSVNKLKLKRSAVTGRYPTTSSLDLGELAINTYDGKVFFKKDDGVQTIVQLADVSGSILSASYAQTSSYSDNFTVNGPVNVYGSQYISGSLTVGNDITAQRLVVQTISSSVIYSSGSNVFGDELTDTQQFTGSVTITGSLKVNGTIGNFTGSTNFLPKFFDPNNLNNSVVYQTGSSIAINETNVTVDNPEALFVFQTHPTSINVVTGKGNLNHYLQNNIQNTNQGVSASSDVVATANNGNESNFYIDMGINSENYSQGFVGDANDAYVYAVANNLHIGSAATGSQHLGFFVGGSDVEANNKLQLNPNNQHQMSGSLDTSGSITATSFITRGATAAQFVKGDGTLDSTNYLSSSVFYAESASFNAFSASIRTATASLYTATASLNAFSASILSYTASNNATIAQIYNATASIYNATASLYAATASLNAATASLYADSASINLFSASFKSFSASINAYTASQNVLNGTYATTGSNIFKGNQTISGSLSVSGSTNIFGTTNLTGSVNVSGSTGTAITANVDTIVFTGSYAQSGSVNLSSSVDIVGSLVVNGRNYINDSSSFSTRTLNLENTSASVLLATASLYSATASIYLATASLYAATASLNLTTASFNAFSASMNAYTASNNGTIQALFAETASLEAATASLYAFSASINSYTSSNNDIVAQLYRETASLKEATASLYSATASIYSTTESLYNFSASINAYTSSNNDIIAQLYATTASLKNATASLYTATASIYSATASLYAASESINAFSASVLSYTASQNVLNGTFATTASNTFYGTETVSGSVLVSGSIALQGDQNITGNLTVTNTITAQKLVVQTISSSVIYSSGSNVFGDELTDVQSFTGSVEITGSLTVNGRNYINDSSSFSTRVFNLEETSASILLATASIYSATSSLYNATASIYLTTASLYEFSASMNLYTASTDATIAQIQNATASIYNATASIYLATESLNRATASIYNTTASLYAFSASINSYTASTDATIAQIQLATASIYSATASLYAETASLKFASASINLFTASINAYTASMNAYTASNNGTIQALFAETASIQAATASLNLFSASFNEFSASVLTHTASVNTFSASINSFTSSINAYTASNNGTISQLFAETASLQLATASINLATASLYNATASIYNATASLYAASASINAFSASMNAFTASQKVLNGTYATTGSNVFIGNQTVTGSLFTTGSNTLIGVTNLTGALNVSGSETIAGYVQFMPVSTNVNNSISASYIYVSGSTNDLYFTQNGGGYGNTTRLRWLEGNLYTGLLNGGLITAATGSTTFNVSSGSGIIVNLNASIGDNPYPTVKYINWNSFTNVPLTYLTSSIQTFVGIDNTGNVVQQTGAFNNGQYNTVITIGTVLHQNKSTVNASITYPNVAYGWKQRSYDFVKAFGPLKLSGLTINTSSSLGLTVGSGTAFADGRNYQVDPNNPSYITDPGTSVSKIFRYWQSGSEFVQDTNASLGYTSIDPTQYNDGTSLIAVSPATPWTNQRVFWYPNSATKGIVVYYGRGQYASSTEALANLNTETFLEVENTKQNAVYLGSITIKYNGVFTTPADYIISPAGIFRSVGGSGGGGTVVTTRLIDLSDVAAAGATSGQALVYDSTAAKWANKSFISASISGNAATATTASFAVTASNAITASSADDFLVRGTLTAQNIVVQTITSSIDFVTGSTRFGTLSSNTHQFTGSVSISGSLDVTAGVVNSLTSSYAVNADLLDGLDSTSFVSTGSFGAETASFNAFSASINAYTASNNTTIQAIYAETASLQAATASLYAASASINAFTASINSYTSSAIIDSGSVSTRLVSLEAFSSSLDTTFATDADLNALSSSFIAHTASINAFSASMNAYTASNNTTILAIYAETASIQLATSSLYAASASINAFTASINSYTASNNGTISQLFAETASILAHTASINAFSASINAYTSSNNDAITSIYSATASLNLATASLNLATASLYAATASIYSTTQSLSASIGLLSSSFLAFSGSYNTGSFSGSLVGTASWASNAVISTYTSEWILGANGSSDYTFAGPGFTGSAIDPTIYLVRGQQYKFTNTMGAHPFRIQTTPNGSVGPQYNNGVVNNDVSNGTLTFNVPMEAPEILYYQCTAHPSMGGPIYILDQNAVSASYAVTASSADDFLVRGTLTAQTIVVQTITSSVNFVTGSTKFGTIDSNTHEFTGSVSVSGSSISLNGSNVILTNQTSSMSVLNAQTASYWSGSIINAVSTSFAETASYWSGSIINAATASFVQIAQSASYWSGSIINAETASFVTLAQSASYWSGSITNALSSSFASTASYWSGSIQNAVSAAFATLAASASYALTASYAANAGSGGGGGLTALYILDEGIVQGTASYLDFNGAGVTATVYGGTASINIPGGGGGSSQSGGNAILTQSVANVTWSFTHNLETQYPVFTIYDNNNDVIIPQRINAVNTSSALIYFSSARTGYAVASKGGDITSASYALIANSASFASTASFVRNAQTASYVLLSDSASYWSGSIINAESASFASTASYTPNAIVNAVLDVPLNDTIEFTLGNGTTSLVTINNVGTASLANTASYWSGSIINAETASYVVTAQTASFVTLAQTASFVTLAQSASYWSGSIQNAVSAAFADFASSASYSLTASYATFAANGGGGGISAISIADEGILQGSASYFDFTGAGVSVSVASNTASFTITGGGGSGTAGLTTTFTQSVAAVTWSFNHSLNTRFPLVQVYDTSFNQVQPQYISSSNASTVIIGFGVATAGYAVASMGGTLSVTGSNVVYNQSSAATTWSFAHNLNNQYPIFQVFDSNNEVIVPERIVAVSSTGSLIYFPVPVAGKAVATIGGMSGSGGSGAGFPFSGSAVITGSFLVSGSFADFTNVGSFTGNLTGSLLGTASYALNFPAYTVRFTQSAAATTWSFVHSLNTRNPIVQVYGSDFKQLIPNEIVGVDANTVEVRFDYAESGYAVLSNGGGLYVTGSTSTLVQSVAAVTWSFAHNLNSKYPNFEVYDNNDYVIIPAGIKAVDNNNAELYFSTAQTGRAIANFSGIEGAPNATSASYAASGSNFVVQSTIRLDQSLMDYASVNSSIVGSNNLFTQATGSYTAAFFKYTAASGSNARAGEVSAVWNGGTVEFMDVSTNDIGNTNSVTGSVSLVSGDVQFNVQTNTSGWRIKSTATFI